jgi:NADP-dependent 3-hydroxy acid dehydrogenase YdfG
MNVFITGASSGIGAALARRYAGAGANLGLFARRQVALDQLVATLPADGRVIAYAGDVRDAKALSEAALAFITRFGAPDIVIANAGISQGTLTEHVDDAAAFRSILDTNASSTPSSRFSPQCASGDSGRW